MRPHLYKRPCPSVGPSVGRLVRRSVMLSSKSLKNGLLRILNDRQCRTRKKRGRKEWRGEWNNEKVAKKWKMKKSLKDASLALLGLVLISWHSRDIQIKNLFGCFHTLLNYSFCSYKKDFMILYIIQNESISSIFPLRYTWLKGSWVMTYHHWPIMISQTWWKRWRTLPLICWRIAWEYIYSPTEKKLWQEGGGCNAHSIHDEQ